MRLIRIIILVIGMCAVGQYSQAAQRSEGEIEKSAAKRVYSQEQQIALQNLVNSLNRLGPDGEWPKRKELIKQAIEKQAIHPDDITFDEYAHATPLYQAVMFADEDFTKYLLAKDADPNRPAGSDNKNVLWCVRNDLIAQMLLTRGADPNCKSCFKENLFFNSDFIRSNPRLALVYFCAGTNPKMLNEEGQSALINFSMMLEKNHYSPATQHIVSLLGRMGVPEHPQAHAL